MVRDVAIVVPIYRQELNSNEITSIKHLREILGKYDKYAICGDGLEFDDRFFGVKRFEDQFFMDRSSYSRLLLSRGFYEAFNDYKYILIYQLDCLVFSDQLLEWCEMDFDYIGAPWLKSKQDPSKGFSRVGNGGLSLRKVESFLKVLDSQRYPRRIMACSRDVFWSFLNDLQYLPITQRYRKKLRIFREMRRGVRWYTSHYTLNEDHFWSDRAKLFYPNFKIAPVEVALSFSFERFPRYCFEQNSRQLPFGCHAWTKWDREFWEPYLLY